MVDNISTAITLSVQYLINKWGIEIRNHTAAVASLIQLMIAKIDTKADQFSIKILSLSVFLSGFFFILLHGSSCSSFHWHVYVDLMICKINICVGESSHTDVIYIQ